MTRRTRNFVLFILAALLAILFLPLRNLAGDPRVEWRVQALVSKAGGDIPELSWTETIVGIIPISWRYEFNSPLLHVVHLNKFVEDNPCPALWTTPIGRFWGRLEDHRVLEDLVVEQLLERVYDHRFAGVRAGDTVIDVGGHLGTFTRFAIDRGAQLVVAFEPEPTNLVCFRKTFQDEIRRNQVIVVPAAAWRTKEELRFELSEHAVNTGMGRIDESGRLVVQGVTIDATVEELKLSRVDFIKMDIEGAERHALEGARKVLAQHGPRMALCIYHRPDDRQVIPRIVTEARPSYSVALRHQQAYFYEEASTVKQDE